MFDSAAGRSAQPRAGVLCTSRRSRRWRSTSSATCGRRSPGIANRAAARGDAFHAPAIAIRTGDTPASRARPLPARAGRHPDHHARVALPAADLERARGAALGRHGHHRRDPRAGPDQARRAPGAVARAAGGARPRRAAAAHRSVGDAASARRSRAVPRRRATPRGAVAAAIEQGRRGQTDGRSRSDAIHDEFGADRATAGISAGHDRRHLAEEAARAPHRSAGRGHGEDRARPRRSPAGPASQGPARSSIWSAIHPRLLELVQAHHSTLIFVNSRRIAERLASALNELAGEPLVRAHHGSLARAQRIEIEDLLKAGQIRGLVATSSLELGIDMGAIDLGHPDRGAAVGRQRHAAHRPRRPHASTQPSRGIIVPKFRGDLVACAAVTRAMHEAQHRGEPLSAESARRARAADRRDGGDGRRGTWTICSRRSRSAAPFAELSRGDLRGRARHALGTLSVGRLRGSPAAR